MKSAGRFPLRHLLGVAGVSFGYAGRAFPCVLAMVAIASFCFLKAFEATFPEGTVIDVVIWAFDPSAGVSLLWVVCPMILMVALSRMWKEKEHAHVIVAHGSEERLFLSYFIDVFLFSLAATAVLLGTLTACGFAVYGVASNLDSPSSLMVSYSKATAEGVGLAAALPVFALYGFLSLMFSGMAFYATRAVCKNSAIAFGIVTACGLPQVHGATSFVYDAAKALGLNMPIVNPLSYLYESASVFYPSWIPGAGHGLWALALIVGCLTGVGFVATKGRDYLRA